MFITMVILTLALTLDGQVHAGKIVGGREAVPHSRPYMVIILSFQGLNRSNCDGFLLNEDFVMTAAHCQASNYTILLGRHNLTKREKGQYILVEKAFPHEDYDNMDFKNDIMILKLKSKAQFGTNVKPIPLAGRSNRSPPESCIVSGWGFRGEPPQRNSDVLMEVNVTLVDTARCPRANTYCSAGETGPAMGDSGGPLVCEDGVAYGVVSSKSLSGVTTMYSFTEISDYSCWINSVLKLG